MIYETRTGISGVKVGRNKRMLCDRVFLRKLAPASPMSGGGEDYFLFTRPPFNISCRCDTYSNGCLRRVLAVKDLRTRTANYRQGGLNTLVEARPCLAHDLHGQGKYVWVFSVKCQTNDNKESRSTVDHFETTLPLSLKGNSGRENL